MARNGKDPNTVDGGARTAALAALSRVLGERRSLTEALAGELPDVAEPADRALAQELAYGVMRLLPRLDAWLSLLLSRPLRSRDQDIRIILLLGLYQLAETRVPPHATVHTSVELARGRGKRWAAGLVNAVLRRFQAESEAIRQRADERPEALHAHPPWLLARLRRDWPEDWREICAAANRRPPMTLRVNRRRTDPTAYRQRLAAAGFAAEPHPFAADALVLEQPLPVERLPGFAEGEVSVQDAAGQLAADLLALAPGMRVLDACAAPGSKTCHMLEREPRLAGVTALDVDAARLDNLRENLTRLGLRAHVIAGDGLDRRAWWDGRVFERILLDAPCSATGVVRRHPDIKYLRREADIPALADTQLRLLRAVWPMLDRGGMLVYSTCSVLADENSGVVRRFLQEQEDGQSRMPACPWGIRLAHGQQIPTGMADMDGFFYAVLRKA